MDLSPDYGLRLRQDGVPADQDIVFYGFELTGFDVLGEGRFTAMTEVEYDDQPHAVSLDFTFDQLEAIIDRAPVGIATWLEGELARDPNTPRSLDFDEDEVVTFDVRTRLGPTEEAEGESFVPFIAVEIL